MKKVILSMFVAVAALLTTSCAKDATEGVDTDANKVAVSFNTALQEQDSRAVPGGGTLAKNLTVLVYDKDGKLLDEQTKTLDDDLKATVEFSLVKGETYAFAFWAQADDAPFVLNKENGTVEINYAEANNEKGDAFFYYRSPSAISAPLAANISLKRPFAQVNLATSDVATVKRLYGDDALQNAKSSLVINGIYNKLNLKDGKVMGDAAEVTFTTAAIPEGQITIKGTDYDYLGTNYVLVGTSKSLSDVKFEISDIAGCETKTISLNTVPVQRNYRTNIYGALFSIGASFNVESKPAFTGDNNVGIVIADEATIEEQLNVKNAIVEVNKSMVFDSPAVKTTSTLIIDKGCTVSTNSTAQTIMVSKGSNLTIKGEGKLVGPTNDNIMSYPILVGQNGTLNIDGNLTIESGNTESNTKGHPCIRILYGTVNIYGGYFHAKSDADGGYNSCILLGANNYANSKSAACNIYGGVFDNEKGTMCINIDGTYGRYNHVTIYGGTFVGYNPATGDSGAGIATFVADEHESVEVTYKGKQAWEVRKKTTTTPTTGE